MDIRLDEIFLTRFLRFATQLDTQFQLQGTGIRKEKRLEELILSVVVVGKGDDSTVSQLFLPTPSQHGTPKTRLNSSSSLTVLSSVLLLFSTTYFSSRRRKKEVE